MSNIHQLHDSTKQQSAPPESTYAGGGSGGGDNYAERLASLEANMKHLATQNDVTKVKVWVLSGVLGGMVIAASIATFIAKIFLA